MNFDKPIIGISMGDPAGIGPEIIAKALSQKQVYQQCRPVVVGDAGVIKLGTKIAGIKLDVHSIQSIAEAQFEWGQIDVLDLNNVDLKQMPLATISPLAGNAAFEAIKTVIELALAGKIDATVTAPIHKESLNLAGHSFAGHTEIYAQYTNTRDFAMLLVEGNLRVIHVSTHVPIRDVYKYVTQERIFKVIRLLNDACKAFGIDKPKIAVAGLNPHASDGGLFGTEEKNEIEPAVQQARAEGMLVDGPFPPDILFPMAKEGSFDGLVAMYHDQGHIPFKLLGFDWDDRTKKMGAVRGVNITLGLPIIRVSVDHGTAFEIAGKGLASPDSLLQALEYATLMANKRMAKK